MIIEIDQQLQKKISQCSLGIITAKVTIREENYELWEEISNSIKNISEQYTLEHISSSPQIQELRSSYKLLGKDPARYRGASEALLRRVLQGKGIYKINTIVDINNLVAMESLFSVGSYDMEKIEFPVTFSIGRSSEIYKGIGKNSINIANLPVLIDQRGAFGSPTSDSERTMITNQTSKLMMVIYSFNCDVRLLESALNRAVLLLKTFASASQITTKIIN